VRICACALRSGAARTFRASRGAHEPRRPRRLSTAVRSASGQRRRADIARACCTSRRSCPR
jgi:hypothetical protein